MGTGIKVMWEQDMRRKKSFGRKLHQRRRKLYVLPDDSEHVGLKALQGILKRVSIALASARIHKLTVNEEDGPHNLRAQLHVMLFGPTGSFKSTIMRIVRDLAQAERAKDRRYAKETPLPILIDLTKAGLLGSVGKGGEIIAGSAWLCRNSLLCLDEFLFHSQDDGSENLTVFLGLLEDQEYARSLGLFSRDVEWKDGDLFYEVHAGKLHVKTSFAMICATMKRLSHMRSPQVHAFVNRTCPYQFKFNEPEQTKILRGEWKFTLQHYDPPPEVELSKRTYFRIVKFARKNLPWGSENFASTENFPRAVGDLCRIYAVTGKFDKAFWKEVLGDKVSATTLIGSQYRSAEQKIADALISAQKRGAQND
jgi:hypothetical protein